MAPVAFPQRPDQPQVPASPCLDCLRGHHQGPTTTTCDPIMAGLGMWISRREAAIEAEVAELKRRALELRKKNK